MWAEEGSARRNNCICLEYEFEELSVALAVRRSQGFPESGREEDPPTRSIQRRRPGPGLHRADEMTTVRLAAVVAFLATPLVGTVVRRPYFDSSPCSCISIPDRPSHPCFFELW